MRLIVELSLERIYCPKGEFVVVIELDMPDMDVETFYYSYLAEIMVEVGSTVVVGSAITFLTETGDEIFEAKSRASSAASSAPAATPMAEGEGKVVVAPSSPSPVAAAPPSPVKAHWWIFSRPILGHKLQRSIKL